MTLTPEQVRNDIPFLKDYIYLDNGATTPVPMPVQKAMADYYNLFMANIERGAYSVSHEASERFEAAREDTARLLVGCGAEEFVFTRNLTQSSNIVAYALEHPLLTSKDCTFQFMEPIVEWKNGDRIVGTVLEHHSNTMPWLRLAKRLGLEYVAVPPGEDCVLSPEDILGAMNEKTKLVTFQHVSNVLGSIHPVKEITRAVKKEHPDCLVFIDGSQGPGHVPVNVKDIGCDFYGFSGHKGALGPQGTGGLYVRKELLERMEPMDVGGGIIADVSSILYKLREDDPAKRFNAGTPNIPGMLGLGRAAKYVMEEIGVHNVDKRERKLASMIKEGIENIPGITIYGPRDKNKCGGVVSFTLEGWITHDVSNALDSEWKILARSGHHCCHPLSKWLGIWEDASGTVRTSPAYYNTEEEVETLIKAIKTLAGV